MIAIMGPTALRCVVAASVPFKNIKLEIPTVGGLVSR